VNPRTTLHGPPGRRGVDSLAMNPSRQDPAYSTRPTIATPSDDLSVVRRIAGGDESALAVLYDRWAQPVYSVVAHLLKDADGAEDVVEETFWQIWQRASSYDASRGTVRTWILTIARSRALDRLRSRKRNREEIAADLTLLRDPAPDPSQYIENDERSHLVHAALRELPDEQRRALDLAYFRGLSQSEIAEFLGEPLGTIKTRMRLGMQKLRDKLIGLRESRA
jgi:RNA polymerase sigma-70 factor (ECF subfamily)